MTDRLFEQPPWRWQETKENDYVHQWVKPLGEEVPDVILYGAPLSRSSISVSGASLFPEAFRRMWPKFAVYNIDEDIDLSPLSVRDGGDVPIHTTNIILSHNRIEEATAYLAKKFPSSITCLIGGDHSITACAVRGIKKAFPNETIGVFQLDTHLDVRNPEEIGPANGTPIRQLVDARIVKGEHIFNIGPHGYFNAKPLIQYAKKQGIRFIPLHLARKQNLLETVRMSLGQLSAKTDRIYATVDMDVLHIGDAPGVPASTPGGMAARELFDILLEIGKWHKVKHIDFVCIDPAKDSSQETTVKTGVYGWLQFLTGFFLRKFGMNG